MIFRTNPYPMRRITQFDIALLDFFKCCTHTLTITIMAQKNE